MGALKSKARNDIVETPVVPAVVEVKPSVVDSAADRARAEAEAAAAAEAKLRSEVRLALIVSAATRGFLARLSYEENRRNFGKRAHIVRELAATERSYVAALQRLRDCFMAPIEDSSFLNEVEFKTCFPQVDTILTTNESLLATIEPIVAGWSYHAAIGHVFVDYVDYFKSYISYVNNYNLANDLISRRRSEKPAFATFLEQLAAKPAAQNQDLFSYLIMPIQRVPRYVMLLSDLLSKTPKDHCDYEALSLAVERIRSIADAINNAKKDADNFQELLAIYHSVRPPIEDLVQPGRVIVAKGNLVDFSLEKHPKGKVYFYFLFSDLLLRCSVAKVDKKTGKSTYNAKGSLDLRMAKVSAVPDGVAKDARNVWKVESAGDVWTLGCKSAEKRDAWMANVSAQVARHAENAESFRLANGDASRKYVTKTLKGADVEALAAQRARDREQKGDKRSVTLATTTPPSPSQHYASGSAALVSRASEYSALPAHAAGGLGASPTGRPTSTPYGSFPPLPRCAKCRRETEKAGECPDCDR